MGVSLVLAGGVLFVLSLVGVDNTRPGTLGQMICVVGLLFSIAVFFTGCENIVTNNPR
jgi:hypothetical protein